MSGFISSPTIRVSPYNDRFNADTTWVGDEMVASGSASTQHDFVVPFDSKLIEGSFCAASGASVGDRVDFYLIGNAGSPLEGFSRKYVDGIRVVPGERRVFSSGLAASVTTDMSFRAVYHASGSGPVTVLLDWMFVTPTI